MARAAADGRPPTGRMSPEERAELLRGMMGELSPAAARFVPRAKIEDTARHWLAGGRIGPDEGRADEAIGDALTLALDVALFTPSASGTTAIDRFARQHGGRPTPNSGPPWMRSDAARSVSCRSGRPIRKAAIGSPTSPPGTASA